MEIKDMKAYLLGPGLQKLIAVGSLIVIYIFFSIFGNNFLSADTFVSILDFHTI